MRTAPLWGLRARDRFMHDTASLTLTDAIQRHRGEADAARRGFNGPPAQQKSTLLEFLNSL